MVFLRTGLAEHLQNSPLTLHENPYIIEKYFSIYLLNLQTPYESSIRRRHHSTPVVSSLDFILGVYLADATKSECHSLDM